MLRRIMPNAVPTDANARLPKARMIDPRGHRFGAGVSAIALILAFLTGTVWLVALALLSIGVSAAFGLKYSIYGVIWRRIAKTLALPKVEPEHEYPPRFAQVLGSVALILALVSFALGRDDPRLGPDPRGRRTADAAGHDRLLPRLPALLPALVGAGSRDPDLDPRTLRRPEPRPRAGADPLQLTPGEAPGPRGRPGAKPLRRPSP